jgi:hypothetical protein
VCWARAAHTHGRVRKGMVKAKPKPDPCGVFLLVVLSSGTCALPTWATRASWWCGAAACCFARLRNSMSSTSRTSWAARGRTARPTRSASWCELPHPVVGFTACASNGRWFSPFRAFTLPARLAMNDPKTNPRLTRIQEVGTTPQRSLCADLPQPTGTLPQVPVQVGDIVVMGTDGLFDNVFDKDVALMAARSLKVRPPHPT